MKKEQEFANDLLDFIHTSPSPFHVVSSVRDTLVANGFVELGLADRWQIGTAAGGHGRYFVTRNDSAIIAFIVGSQDIETHGFRLIGTHTDAPSFRIKPRPEMVAEQTYLRLNVESYGSPILNTWLDRPLSLAGRVSLRGSEPMQPETSLVSLDGPVAIIPNQSLHMNRKVNEGVELNKQQDMLPLIANVAKDFEKDGFLSKLLAQRLDVDPGRIADFDLFLHEYERGALVGLNGEFISSSRLDDLAMVHAGLHALIGAGTGQATNVLICYDNEEVGSRTKQGAASPVLRTLMERLVMALGRDREDFFRAAYRSILLSADMGHGVHPSAVDKHDPVNKPVLNGGPMIKIAANQNFTTDSDTAAVFESLCQGAGVPVQRFVSRSDLQGGSTIGPLSATQLDIRSLDVGNPALAMHSIRELGGVLDHTYMTKAFEAFYAA